MSSGFDSLHFFVPTYRRDSAEVIGAVRRSAVEFLGLEQMPGGKFQLIARTTSGADSFVSTVKMSLAAGQACLEDARRSFGGEDPGIPADVGNLGVGGDDFGGAVAVALGGSGADGMETAAEVVPERVEPRIPTFTFADIEAPQLPTSVR